MGYLTRVDLRRMIAEKLGFYGTGYPTAVTSTTITDTRTANRKREQDDYWNGGTIFIGSGTGGPSAELLTESDLVETETNGGTVDISTVDPFDASCYKLTTTTTAGSIALASWTVVTTPDRDVEVSFRSKGDGALCGRWALYRLTATAADIIASEPTYITGERWTRFVRRVTIPSGCISAALRLYAPSKLGNTAWFDTPSVKTLGQSRYITDWVNASSTWTTAAWSTTPAVGSTYELFYKTFSLDDYNRAINDALRAAYPFLFEMDEDTSITTTSATYSYDLPDSIAPNSVVKVEVEADTGSSTAPYSRLAFWSMRKQGETSTLQFQHGLPTGRTVRVTFCRPLEPMLSDADTVEERWVPYIVARARAELFGMQLGKTSRSDRTQVGENRDAFFQEAAYALKTIAMQWPNTHIKPHLYGG